MDVKLYSIFGISYCGSTIISYILNQSKDIFSLGETHWTLDDKTNATCFNHRDSCCFWTKEFINGLTQQNLYDKLKERAYQQYQIKGILCSNKNWQKHKKSLESGVKIDKALLLFKNPSAFAWSWYKNIKDRPSHNLDRKDLIINSQQIYKKSYLKILFILNTYKIPFLPINYNDFILEPKKYLQEICNFLQIKYNDTMLQNFVSEKNHQIGGNRKCHLESKNIIIDDDWKSQLRTEEIDLCNYYNHQTFDKLLKGES